MSFMYKLSKLVEISKRPVVEYPLINIILGVINILISLLFTGDIMIIIKTVGIYILVSGLAGVLQNLKDENGN